MSPVLHLRRQHSTTITRRNFANEEPNHEPLWFSFLCSCWTSIQHAKSRSSYHSFNVRGMRTSADCWLGIGISYDTTGLINLTSLCRVPMHQCCIANSSSSGTWALLLLEHPFTQPMIICPYLPFFYDAPSLETFNLNVSCHSYYYDISIYGGNMA